MNIMRILSLTQLAALLLSFRSTCSSKELSAEKFDFHIISVSEYGFRTVRLYWRNPDKKLIMMKVYEKDRYLTLESLHTATTWEVTISLNAHSFHIFSLEDFLMKKNTTAILEVPAHDEVLSIPAYVLAESDLRDDLQWVKPNVNSPITSITLIKFGVKDQSNLAPSDECIRGYRELSPDSTQFDVDHEEIFIQALRIDTNTSSSGIVLPMCRSHQSEVGLLDDRPKLQGNSSHLSVEWQMKCPEEGIVYGVIGYNLYYCRWLNSTSCLDSESKLTFKTNDMVLEAEIDGLTPSTQYRIAGTVILANGTESARRELTYATRPAPVVRTPFRPWTPSGTFDRHRCVYTSRFDRWCRWPRFTYGQFSQNIHILGPILSQD